MTSAGPKQVIVGKRYQRKGLVGERPKRHRVTVDENQADRQGKTKPLTRGEAVTKLAKLKKLYNAERKRSTEHLDTIRALRRTIGKLKKGRLTVELGSAQRKPYGKLKRNGRKNRIDRVFAAMNNTKEIIKQHFRLNDAEYALLFRQWVECEPNLRRELSDGPGNVLGQTIDRLVRAIDVGAISWPKVQLFVDSVQIRGLTVSALKKRQRDLYGILQSRVKYQEHPDFSDCVWVDPKDLFVFICNKFDISPIDGARYAITVGGDGRRWAGGGLRRDSSANERLAIVVEGVSGRRLRCRGSDRTAPTTTPATAAARRSSPLPVCTGKPARRGRVR